MLETSHVLLAKPKAVTMNYCQWAGSCWPIGTSLPVNATAEPALSLLRSQAGCVNLYLGKLLVVA